MSNELFDPWALRPVTLARKTVPLEDPRQPGVKGQVTLVELPPERTMVAAERAEEIIADHVSEDGGPAKPLYPSRGGEPIKLTAKMVRTICLMEEMQEGEPRFDFDGLLGLSRRMPRAFWELQNAANDLDRGDGASDPGNEMMDTTGTSSDLPLDTTVATQS